MGVGRERVRGSGRGERGRREGEEEVREGGEGGLQHDECPKMTPDLQVVPDSPHDFHASKDQHPITTNNSRYRLLEVGSHVTQEHRSQRSTMMENGAREDVQAAVFSPTKEFRDFQFQVTDVSNQDTEALNFNPPVKAKGLDSKQPSTCVGTSQMTETNGSSGM